MTVKQLIEALQKFDPELEVVACDDDNDIEIYDAQPVVIREYFVSSGMNFRKEGSNAVGLFLSGYCIDEIEENENT